MSATPAASYPIAIMMARKLISRSGWSLPSWEATGVVMGEHFADPARSHSLVRESDGVQHFLWRGFKLNLYRDAAENYWYNLTGERPSLFVICDRQQDEELTPSMVSADFADAEAAVEKNGAAFAVPIPPEVYLELERFVLEHYRPQPRRKRKREDWQERGRK